MSEAYIETVANNALILISETLEDLSLEKSEHGWHDLGLKILKSALTEMTLLRQENKQLRIKIQELSKE